MFMRLLTLVALVLAVVTAAGCGGEEATLPPATAAPPQQATVDWVEPTAKSGPKLVFEVQRLDVLQDGWRAAIAIRNECAVPRGSSAATASRRPWSSGSCSSSRRDLDEVEQRVKTSDLPGLRRAHTLTPCTPDGARARRDVEGTIAAPGSLAAGRWLRVIFGPLYPDGDPAGRLPRQLTWITDNAHRLRS